MLKPILFAWLVFLDRVKMGAGRADLLEVIDEIGSIMATAERFGMSYRYVLGYLRDLEKASGFRFIELQREGRRAKPPSRRRARHASRETREFHRRVAAAAEREDARILGGSWRQKGSRVRTRTRPRTAGFTLCRACSTAWG